MNSRQLDTLPERTVIDADLRFHLIDWHELLQYRDLFYYLVWRDVKTRYAQSVLGGGLGGHSAALQYDRILDCVRQVGQCELRRSTLSYLQLHRTGALDILFQLFDFCSGKPD